MLAGLPSSQGCVQHVCIAKLVFWRKYKSTVAYKKAHCYKWGTGEEMEWQKCQFLCFVFLYSAFWKSSLFWRGGEGNLLLTWFFQNYFNIFNKHQNYGMPLVVLVHIWNNLHLKITNVIITSHLIVGGLLWLGIWF